MSSDRNLVYNSTSQELPRDVFPKGRLRFSYRTRSRARATLYKDETIDRLREDGEWDILRAVQQEVFRIDEVHETLHGNGSWSRGVEQLRRRIREEGPDATPTFTEVVDLYFEEYSSMRTPGTEARHRHTLRPFGQEKLNGKTVNEYRIDELSEFDLNSVLKDLEVASGTKETYRRTLAGMFSWYMEWELAQHRTKGRTRRLTYNPAAEVERRKTGGDVTTLDEHQIAAVLRAARPHERAPFLMFAQLGLRAKELIHLRKGVDLDLEELKVDIQERGPDPKHKCPDCQADGWSPKRPRFSGATNNSIRTLHIPQEKQGLIECLRQHAEMWPVERGDYFFQNPSPNSSGPWTYETLRYRFKQACEATEGVVRYGQKTRGGVTLHSLRHTCATEMIRAGVPLSVAAKVLGHSVQQLTTTYSHLLAEDTAIGLRAVPDYDMAVATKKDGADASE